MLHPRSRSCALAAATALVAVLGVPAKAGAADPCALAPDPIACENAKPGSPRSAWDVPSWRGTSIQGFTTEIGVDAGQVVRFKVKTTATAYRLDIYRLGWYGGLGARKVRTVRPFVGLPQTQPACRTEAATGLVDCGNWAVSARWAVPADAISGVYVAKLVREDGVAGANHVVFVVRDDDGGSDLLFQTSDTTWQAYNQYGGNSLYRGVANPAREHARAYKVSYNRPVATRGEGFGSRESVFYAEYPLIRFLERNGYDVSYTTGADVARAGDELLEHRVFLSVGHDEYVSADERGAIERARDAGVSLAYLSGNSVFWKTRWEAARAGGAPGRTLVCYKEDATELDPSPVWTGLWRDARHSPPGDGGRPENALKGSLFGVGGRYDAIQVPAEDRLLRFWRESPLARSAGEGGDVTLAAGTLGYEWDTDQANGFRPPGMFTVSETTVADAQQWIGVTQTRGPATHELALFRAPSGALVFGAGTIQWTWGLDPTHDFPGRGAPVADPNIQQATVNVLADMGAQPASLQSGLVPVAASTDVTAPQAAISTPLPDTTVAAGTTVLVAGSASDSGGLVAAVEVSTDGGRTWLPAAGRGSWSLSFVATAGTYDVVARAVDDTGNIGPAAGPVTVTVR